SPTLLAAGIGCASQPPAESTRIDPVVWQSPHPVSVQHTSSTVVAEGAPPLAYQAMEKGTLRVVDESNGKQLAAAPVRAGQILAVTPGGVMLSGAPLGGRIAADHRYMIYLDIERPEAGPPGAERQR